MTDNEIYPELIEEPRKVRWVWCVYLILYAIAIPWYWPKDYQANLNAVSCDGILILLDESGELGSTAQLSNRWRTWRLESKNIHLAIGPVDGFDEGFIQQHQKLSLGPLTMTYEMAAVVLLEQLYRVSEIERGSPYHRV